MKVRMLITQESPEHGVLEKWTEENQLEYDLPAEVERAFIRRGIAENVSAPEYISKSKRGKGK